jgi:hypothetical protein
MHDYGVGFEGLGRCLLLLDSESVLSVQGGLGPAWLWCTCADFKFSELITSKVHVAWALQPPDELKSISTWCLSTW